MPELVASYTYDAWGNILSATGSLAQINPFRYRGYYYDTETSFYYLRSRYYNPSIGRFLNADVLYSTGQGLVGFNMFVYCGNNPTCHSDYGGTRYCETTTIAGETWFGKRYSCYWQKQVTLEKLNPEPIGRTIQGNVYLVKNLDEIRTDFYGDIVVLDRRGPNKDDGVEIQYSYLIKDEKIQREVLTILVEYEKANPTGWNRTVDSMMDEWKHHNLGAIVGNVISINGQPFSSSKHAYFDNNSEGWTLWDQLINGLERMLS